MLIISAKCSDGSYRYLTPNTSGIIISVHYYGCETPANKCFGYTWTPCQSKAKTFTTIDEANMFWESINANDEVDNFTVGNSCDIAIRKVLFTRKKDLQFTKPQHNPISSINTLV